MHSALQAAESGDGFQEVGGLGVVMFAEPLNLAFVTEKHFLLGFKILGDIHVVRGLEAYAGKSIGIEDGDDGVFETPEIIIDAPNKTIQLLNAGNLATLGSGVAGQALYSFFKERWKEVPGLTRFDFPMLSITNEQFEFQNGYRLADETTRKLIRTAGWVERSADNQSILQEYSGIITLGSLGLTDQPYFVQEGSSSASTTNTSFTGRAKMEKSKAP